MRRVTEMKRSLAFILAAVFLTCGLVFAFTSIAFAYDPGTYRVTDVDLNVRSEPNSNCKILGLLDHGDEVQVLASAGSWGRIEYKGSVGWIYLPLTELVTDASSTESSTVTTTVPPSDYTPGKYVVNYSYLNFREEPNGKVIATLKYGDVVEVTEVYGDWGKCDYKGTVGWLSLNYTLPYEEGETSSTTEMTVPTTDPNNFSDFTIGQYTTVGKLYMRTYPTRLSDPVLVLPASAAVTIRAVVGQWGYTEYEGKSGWVMMKYLTKVNNDADSTIVALSTLKGDADLNGKVNSEDARIVLRMAARLDDPESAYVTALCDYDGSGNINANDARLILRKAADLI